MLYNSRTPDDWFQKIQNHGVLETQFPPSPPLVGIETNPGRTTKTNSKDEKSLGIVIHSKELHWTPKRIGKKYKVDPRTVTQTCRNIMKQELFNDDLEVCQTFNRMYQIKGK